jgi:ribosomal protein L37AE/L43A
MPRVERCPECNTPWFEVRDAEGRKGWKCSSCGFRALDGASAEWRNRTYRANTVQLLIDGNHVCALIGQDLVQGISGFGATVQEALRDLADELEASNVTIQVDERTS